MEFNCIQLKSKIADFLFQAKMTKSPLFWVPKIADFSLFAV